MASQVSYVWALERYARLRVDGSAKDENSRWEYFDSSESTLELTMTNDQIFIHLEKALLESLSLLAADRTMRGISKGDSILVIYKIQNETRRFRVKFSPGDGESGETRCSHCVEQLAKYFPIKLTTSVPESQQASSTPDNTVTEPKVLDGDVTLGQIAKAILKEDNLQLPSIYRQCSNISPQSLSMMVKLCLADPTFPAFVDQVEKELEKIKNDSI